MRDGRTAKLDCLWRRSPMFAVRFRALIALIAMLAHATVPAWHFAGCFGWHSAKHHSSTSHCAHDHSHDGDEHLGSHADAHAYAHAHAHDLEDALVDETPHRSGVSHSDSRACLDVEEKQGTWIVSGATDDGHDCPLCDVGFSVSWSAPICLLLWDEAHLERLRIGDRNNGSWLVGEGFTIRGPPVLG